MGRYDDRPYKIGKGKPPRCYSWPKGQSGNPKGPRRKRKQEQESSQDILAEIANLPVEVVDALGRSTFVPMRKAVLMELARDALKGTPAQRRQAVALLHQENFFDLKPPLSQQSERERAEEIRKVVDELAQFAEKEEETRRLLGTYRPD